MQDVERLYCDGKHGKGGGGEERHIPAYLYGVLWQLVSLLSTVSMQPPTSSTLDADLCWQPLL